MPLLSWFSYFVLCQYMGYMGDGYGFTYHGWFRKYVQSYFSSQTLISDLRSTKLQRSLSPFDQTNHPFETK